jgi:hypothetical protein
LFWGWQAQVYHFSYYGDRWGLEIGGLDAGENICQCAKQG